MVHKRSANPHPRTCAMNWIRHKFKNEQRSLYLSLSVWSLCEVWWPQIPRGNLLDTLVECVEHERWRITSLHIKTMVSRHCRCTDAFMFFFFIYLSLFLSLCRFLGSCGLRVGCISISIHCSIASRMLT